MSITRQQSLFPSLPRGKKIADKDGNIDAGWSLGLTSLFQACQRQFSNEGYSIPPLTTADADAIQSLYTPYIGHPLPAFLPDISGNMIFNATSRVPQMFIITYDGASPPNITAASWKTFTLT